MSEPLTPPLPVVKTSTLAVWSLILGILGCVLLLICIGPLFAIPAVICGHMAYSRIKRSGGTLSGGGLALGGLISGYCGIAIGLVWIPLMAAIAIPNFVKARQTAQKRACIRNLRLMDEAKQKWASQNGKSTNAAPTAQDISPFLARGFASLKCPAGGTYSINMVGEPPTCSIQSHRLSASAEAQSISDIQLPETSSERLAKATNELAAATSEEERFYALNDAAKESFIAGNTEDARKYAQELLALLPKFRRDWNYGNAVQDANLVLGRIALKEGDVESAKRYLLEAGKSPGSPQMDSFGPNMSLAEDLLKKGERQTVLEYFKLCRKFWKMENGKLDEWSKAVNAGKIPDFGANLLY